MDKVTCARRRGLFPLESFCDVRKSDFVTAYGISVTLICLKEKLPGESGDGELSHRRARGELWESLRLALGFFKSPDLSFHLLLWLLPCLWDPHGSRGLLSLAQ